MSGRWADVGRCRGCGSQVVRGPDADWCSITATADITPLALPAEWLVRKSGRATYAVRQRGARVELTARDRWQVKSPPSGAGAYVVAEHRCPDEVNK